VSYRSDESGCILSFQDDGAGIPNERKELIFERGYGDHTGYGLYFARQILDLNGIGIRETGTYGRGALFEILIPHGAFRVRDQEDSP
jgi:signal transduction histidine kinase